MTKKKDSEANIEETEKAIPGNTQTNDVSQDDDAILAIALEESHDELINEDEAIESWENPALMANRKANP